MKLLSPILIALLLVVSACSSDLSREDRLADLPTSEHVDPTTDVTIGALYDTVPDLTDTQLYALTNLYIQLREGQLVVIEKVKNGHGNRSKRGGNVRQGQDGKQPRRSPNGQQTAQRKNAKSSKGPRAEVRQKFYAMEQTFLSAGKALLSPNQHADWETFVATADLSPKRPSASQERRRKRGKAGIPAQKEGENPRGRRGERTKQERMNDQRPKEPSAVVSQMKTKTTLNENAPSFVLSALDGTQHALATLTGKPLIVEFGSFTSPEFRETHPKLEKILAPHSAEINFVVIYGAEAYPSDGQQVAVNIQNNIRYAQPSKMTERMKIATEAKQALNIKALILVDDMQNSTTTSWSGEQASTVIVNADGTIHTHMEKTDLALVRAYLGDL